jgi:3-dehydroquinate dehydratase-1
VICVSIAEPTVERCLEALQGLDFAEVRIDAMDVTVDDVKQIFSRPSRLVATFMPAGSGARTDKTVDDDTRKELLMAAIEAGARYVDVEIQAEEAYKRDIMQKARMHGCKVIISFHDFQATPAKGKLEEIIALCFKEGADIAKIACKVSAVKDNIRLLGLLDKDEYHGRTVVIGMGKKGRITRITAPLLGSPFTFASHSKGKETAAGQIEKNILRDVIRLLRDE